MQYREDPKSGNRLSALGFGCMRLPRGINARIDPDRSEELILRAIEQGVNYFDTAYIYMGSEEALGAAFRRNPVRDRIYLATKLPYGQCRRYEDFDRIFSEQLERLNTDYIDYYLIHNLSSAALWENCRSLGIERWISEKKASGKIRQIGFSFHGAQNEFMKLLDMYEWEFCQIQYNYMNENYQAGTAGLQKAHGMGLPVVIMEPLLGGKLANPPKKAQEIMAAANLDAAPASWAFRWLWDQKEVTTVLSGMNSIIQIDKNVKTAANTAIGSLTDDERKTIARIVASITEAYKIPCTGCNYCMPCTGGVNIPECFAAYNASYNMGYITGMMQYMTSTGAAEAHKNFGARRCVKCGKCEKACPQHIPVMKNLEAVGKRMEPAVMRAAMGLFRKITGGKSRRGDL
ncbi:MAG: aldo/keto reductase [Clostridiales bacterium]|jgi:predicted aldo/keto reductase-like oxidoreductase|nr:aldo/keto reductase [Clostridiales bacterium]